MNYKIVQDETELKEFIEWLPELEANETYLVSLFSRKKYFENPAGVSADKNQLKRFTSNKKYLFDKIKQLEITAGAYQTNGLVIPQNTLALYITVNPRSNTKAAKNLLKELADIITSEDKREYSVHKLALNATQVACSRKLYMDFDFDHRNHNEVITEIKSIINADAFCTVVTRGGCHVLVEVAKIEAAFAKSWYQSIMKLNGVDVLGDILLPVPGCCQGNFVPLMIKNS